MALTESTEVDRCDVLADGTIIARHVLVIKRDGTEISREKTDAVIYNKNADVSSAPERVSNKSYSRRNGFVFGRNFVRYYTNTYYW